MGIVTASFNGATLLQIKLRLIARPMNALDLASLLCSRLCHDLMSPVGALNNGIELLSDETDPEMREKCLELLGDSARATANKLKFFRLAFGAGGGFGDEIDASEARTALEGLFGSEGKIELGWVVEDEKLPKGAIRLLSTLRSLPATRWCGEGSSTSAPSVPPAGSRLLCERKVRGSSSTRYFGRPWRQGAARLSNRAPRAPGLRTASPRKAEGRSGYRILRATC